MPSGSESRPEAGIDHVRAVIAQSVLGGVTRLVVEKDGVYTEFWADRWNVHVQDDGRTVKLFARGDGVEPAQCAASFLGGAASEVKTVASSDPGVDTAYGRALRSR